MKVGIYGGSFNPIHFGHTGLANWITKHTDLDQVWLMISPNNPLKDTSILADEQVRLQEAKEAIRQLRNEAIKVSDFEFSLPKPNYTANTLRLLTQQYPEHEFTLIIGEDNLNIFSQWKEYQFILLNYRLFVYPRKGSQYTVAEMINNLHTKDIKEIQVLEQAPYFEISSTELRKNLHK